MGKIFGFLFGFFIVAFIAGGVALWTIDIPAPEQPIERVLPDDRFPR